MTTFNTGNPVPSADAKDRFDNSQTFDEFATGDNDTTVTRTGKTIRTMQGMNTAFNDWLASTAFETVHLTYVPGSPLTVDRSTQLIDYLGSTYRVKSPANFPVTLTGVWATDQAMLVPVTDVALRQELAAPGSGVSIAGTSAAYIASIANQTPGEIAILTQGVANATYRADIGVFGDSCMRTRVRMAISENPAVNIAGDSNAHGAGAVDSYRNSWPNILKRCLNMDFGTVSYGFVPLLDVGSGANTSTDIHQIAFTPQSGWSARESAAGSYVMQGLSFVSTAVGNAISSKIPCFQNRAYIWYIGNPGGGTFNIEVNGVVAATVNTANATVTPLNVSVVPLTAIQDGSCTIRCVTTSAAKVELCGFSYQGAQNETTVNNFSNSGRRLRYMDESVVSALCAGTGLLILPLGYNDSTDCETDPVYFAAFKQRIQWFIDYANANEVPVVVPDCVWDYGPNTNARSELRRLARETKGVYIPFADFFSKAGVPSGAYRVNTLKLFYEPAHLNKAGHKYVAEVIAKAIGLSCSSKKQALDYYDWWYPLTIAASGLSSLGQTSDAISAVRNMGPVAVARMNPIGFVTGNTTPGRAVQASWPSRAGILQAFAFVAPLGPRSNGVSQGAYTFVANGGITVTPTPDLVGPGNTTFITFPVLDRGAV